MSANRLAGSRLDGSGCPVRRDGAEVFLDEGVALVVIEIAAAVSLNAANAGLLLRRRAAVAVPPTRRLGHASSGSLGPVAALATKRLCAAAHRTGSVARDRAALLPEALRAATPLLVLVS